MNCDLLLRQIALRCQRILGPNLAGITVHGSLAFGCFHWQSSDVDFLVVVHTPPTQPQKEALIQALLDLLPLSPPKGLEMSVVLLEHCSPFRYPTPFSLHFSSMHLETCQRDLSAYCRDMHGTDRDLAAHFAVAREVGFSIYGPPPRQIFAPVPRACYLDSILRDIQVPAEEAAANPVYFVLNQCRVLAFLYEGLVCSKEGGGHWGLAHLNAKWTPLIQACLLAYRTGASPDLEPDLLVAFCGMVQNQLQNSKKRTS